MRRSSWAMAFWLALLLTEVIVLLYLYFYK